MPTMRHGRREMEHLGLPCVGEYSMGYPWICKTCGKKLRTEKSAKTNWQEWYFTADNKRHFKNKCNIKKIQGGRE